MWTQYIFIKFLSSKTHTHKQNCYKKNNNNLLSNNVKLKYAQSQMKSYLLSYMMTRQENDKPTT